MIGRRISTVSLLAVLAIMVSGSITVRAKSSLVLGDDPRIQLDDFRVTVFAENLDFPMGITQLPDGSLLVGISRPTGGGYFSSTGELRRFVDNDQDGVADDDGLVVADELPGTIVAVVESDPLVFVTSAAQKEERISIFRGGDDWTEPLELIGSLDFGFNGEFLHQSYGLAVRALGDDSGRYELFFNVGSVGNVIAGATVDVTGLVSATLDDATIYRVEIDDTGPDLAISGPELIATGLRNAAAFVFDPGTGDLLITDNGIDTPDEPLIALSADELNRMPADQIGGDPEDFGFPDSYVEYATGETVGNRGIPPLIAFRPINRSENEGVASLVVAPVDFPDGLNTGVFVGFHGQFDDRGIINEENPLVYADLETGETLDFIENESPSVGHLDSLVATDDTLYVVDLCGSNGYLASSKPCGTIYAIQVVD